jgi:hypothetical protein
MFMKGMLRKDVNFIEVNSNRHIGIFDLDILLANQLNICYIGFNILKRSRPLKI